MTDHNNQVISTPICDFLRDYASSGISRFHMPGHKGCGDDLHGLTEDPNTKAVDSDFPKKHLSICPGTGIVMPYAADITEIAGADSLYEAGGIILESERNASALFGSAATFYSTEGSSHCIRAMLALVTGFCSDSHHHTGRPVILAARNVHRAFLTACALLDLDVEWLFPENGNGSLYSCPVSTDEVREKLKTMKNRPAAVYLTSPDYLGNMQDVASIAQAAHEYDVPLLVDNAHGAYLHFLDTPAHPLDLGADICCDSAHKTLPALTGCACLHIGKKAPAAYREHARQALSMFGSTSPSYLLLASLDRTNKILAGSWKDSLQSCISRIRDCKQELYDSGWNIQCFPGQFSDQSSGKRQSECSPGLLFEPLKITIRTSASGYSGNEAADILRKNGVECEFSDPDFVVLMPSPYNSPEDFRRLNAVMKSLAADNLHNVKGSPSSGKPTMISLYLPHRAVSIRSALFSPSHNIPADQAAGRICADAAITCPPAIPVIIPGEIISETAVDIMKYYGFTHIRVCDIV